VAAGLPIPDVMLSSGAPMPLVGLGTWDLSGEEGYRTVRTALDLGYRLIDTATMYGNEAVIGRGIRDSRIPLEELFVTTKLQPGDAGKERETIHASLDALGLERVDLWLVHWPPPDRLLLRTWERFLAVRDDGLAVAVGVSNYSISQIDRLVAETGEGPTVNQIPWAPALFDAGLLAASRERRVVVEGYSPFKNTNLADPDLLAIASHHGVSAAQVVVRWHIQHDVVVIPKSVSAARLEENLDVMHFELSDAEMRTLDRFH
jgi:2,5-diketo-D-gluconate reductase A